MVWYVVTDVGCVPGFGKKRVYARREEDVGNVHMFSIRGRCGQTELDSEWMIDKTRNDRRTSDFYLRVTCFPYDTACSYYLSIPPPHTVTEFGLDSILLHLAMPDSLEQEELGFGS